MDAGAVESMFSVERSAAMRGVRRDRFRQPGRSVTVVDRLDQVGVVGAQAVMHASELYDAVPVHRVVMRADGLRELWVESTAGGLGWVERPADNDLLGYFDASVWSWMPGSTPRSIRIWSASSRATAPSTGEETGLAVVLDYGYPARRLYDPREGGGPWWRTGGTASNGTPAGPGIQDLTAHVNWDDLRTAGQSRGWREIGLWQLAEFIARSRGRDEPWGSRSRGRPERRHRQEIKRLLDPDGMGSDLKVLVRGKERWPRSPKTS